ncbi:MAG: hypothetical protein E5X72_32050 [Mesorhizobium sp.]|uniref:hypothetical protein n=1 Tax=Mesorhizobium sp. TaxID=1871066 RepID=UPI0011F6255E|nr:hypothetical protein [Mesorhizobium sp.]TIO99969.1 MAG: hypothetical protein E5X72_32050 [Mesorhizobium sp.]
MRILLIIAMSVVSQFAEAGQGPPPFPRLDTQGYCTALVSKMLVKAEQQVEKDKCLTDETTLKARLEPFWYLVTPDENQRLMRDYMKEVNFQTYFTVASFVASALGWACIDRRVSCGPGEPTTEAVFSALNSDSCCHAKFPDDNASELRNCLNGETSARPIWPGTGPRCGLRQEATAFNFSRAQSSHPSRCCPVALPATLAINA